MSHTSTLHTLLSSYITTSEEASRSAIDREIWQTFGTTGAVFISDMARFSQTCLEHGIVYYLAMVSRMQIVVTPIIQNHGGVVIKFEADNCFARFAEVEQAIDAAIEIQRAIAETNRKTPSKRDIELSCGIDYGDFLLIDEDQDCFGNPVNRASKLGEDIAGAGEILVSRDAMNQVKQAERFALEHKQYSISGMTLDVCQILYEA